MTKVRISSKSKISKIQNYQMQKVTSDQRAITAAGLQCLFASRLGKRVGQHTVKKLEARMAEHSKDELMYRHVLLQLLVSLNHPSFKLPDNINAFSSGAILRTLLQFRPPINECTNPDMQEYKEFLQQLERADQDCTEESALLRCDACDSTDISWESIQKRAADEGATIDCKCSCGNMWSLSN
jgi:DNA-directed RNA polymerase subunit M/transcription elongation factor TFIIS